MTWEVELVRHLAAHGAPVARVVADPFVLDGRMAVLTEWAPGSKPSPSTSTYELLGSTAARIHAAADSFSRPTYRVYDLSVLIDEQLARMRPLLDEIGRYDTVVALTDRLRPMVASPSLDAGVCHIDLTLDNVHRDGDAMIAFDFDSSGWSWRAFEPYGVLLYSQMTGERWFADWLRGYRSVRPFSATDERAVSAFAVIGDLRVVAWKAGVAESSQGEPELDLTGLDQAVDGWVALTDACA